jgi:galactose mutarotase-like enzyme
MNSISNDVLSIKIAKKGAELQSIFHKENNLEYMWSGDSSYWAKRSPVLFPIVGGLKNNTYNISGTEYQLGRHGFARDNVFEVVELKDSSVTYVLRSNDQIKTVYPYNFLFLVQYTLDENKVHITFTVENIGVPDLLFSVGAHPAFAVPIGNDTSYEDYYLKFNKLENAQRWQLSNDGLIDKEPVPFLQNADRLPLKKELFYEDAIVLKNLQSNSISIVSDKTRHGVTVEFNDFPYMGIWAAKDADFVCIEPWCGIADGVDATGNLQDKEGINVLPSHEQFIRTYTIEVF